LRKSLVDPKKILLPHHIKLAIMEQFVKALPKTGYCFKYLCKSFPYMSEAERKKGIFVGPVIRKRMFDADFLLTITEVEREAWIAVLLPSSFGTTRTLSTLLLLQIYHRNSKSRGA
jgi:hypothetical protein